MTYKPWYTESEAELRESCKDPEFRANVEKRLAECEAVNASGDRCILSKYHAAKLKSVLNG